MNYLCLFSEILIALTGLFSITQYFHMLQQNSYYNSRYCKWLFETGYKKIILNLVSLVILTVLFVFKLFIITIILSMI